MRIEFLKELLIQYSIELDGIEWNTFRFNTYTYLRKVLIIKQFKRLKRIK